MIDGLGDKVSQGVGRAVALARKDLTTYRHEHPDWVADATERGLANWIHDRLWRHITTVLDGVPGVQFLDDEPHREVFVGVRYRLRIKRHHEDGRVSTYPTQMALEFFEQEPTFEGWEEIRLFAGYEWDRTSRTMGAAVVSLRDGRDNIVWLEALPEVDEPAGQVHELTSGSLTGGPTAPVVDLSGDEQVSDADPGQP